MGFMTGSALATTTYDYTGNAFNDFRNGGACPPTCNITGSFTVATPLAPDLPLTLITPISFSLSAGLTTLVDGDPANTSLEVSTDASGAISTWSWVVLGPEASISAEFLPKICRVSFSIAFILAITLLRSKASRDLWQRRC